MSGSLFFKLFFSLSSFAILLVQNSLIYIFFLKTSTIIKDDLILTCQEKKIQNVNIYQEYFF